jgi:hypothetical protein
MKRFFVSVCFSLKLSLFLLVSGCFFHSLVAQSETNLSLATWIQALQGAWTWDYIQIDGKPLSRRHDWYATDLRIDGNRFVMGFSEAACAGEIVLRGEDWVLVPDSVDRVVYHYPEAEVKKWSDDTIILLFRNGTWPYGKADRRVDYVFGYRRPR